MDRSAQAPPWGAFGANNFAQVNGQIRGEKNRENSTPYGDTKQNGQICFLININETESPRSAADTVDLHITVSSGHSWYNCSTPLPKQLVPKKKRQ